MIQMQSRLKVADNSGAYIVQCIKVCGSTRKKVAGIGDIIMVSVKKAAPQSQTAKGKLRKGDMSKAIIVRVKNQKGRVDNSYIRFDDNAVVLLTDQGEPRGSRVFGPLARDELRNSQCAKIISLAAEVL